MRIELDEHEGQLCFLSGIGIALAAVGKLFLEKLT
jgi:hypothetical protein